MGRLRIAFVLDWFAYYAAPIVAELSRECDVMVITRPHGFELGLGRRAEDQKRALFRSASHVAMVRGRQSDPTTLEAMLRVSREVGRFRPDIVHAQVHSDWRLLGVGAQSAGHVVTVHDVSPHPGDEGQGTRLQRLVRHRLIRDADAVVVHGKTLAELAATAPWHTPSQVLRSIPHGALEQPVSVTPIPARPTLLFFGRIERYKGLDVLISAVELAAEKVPELQLIIAGRGPDVDRCRSLVTRPELFEWRVGFIDDAELPLLFSEAALVCLPYIEASQSGVVPLAFANGRPVIASAVGGLPEAVSPGVTGLLVEASNTAALAAAIADAFSDAARLQRMGEAALCEVVSGEMSPRAIAAKHIALYEDVLRNRARR